jgi:hypothetical protein
MCNQRGLRPFSVLLLLLISAGSLLWCDQASAQSYKNFDAAVSPFVQFTGNSSGNGITDSASTSMGGLASFRQSYKPWLGYEVNYSYTRFSEAYTGQPVSVQNNVHEATGAYLIQAPKLLMFQPFVAVGTGYLLFLPTEVGGQRNHQQGRMPILFELGVNYPILTSHLGARVEYRGLDYKTPNFNQSYLTTGASRLTSEVAVGLYVHF